MGVVYKAEDTTLERTVALKFLAQHLLNDEEAKERFLREAKAAAALDHPNICTVYEIAEVDGKTFISMAFLKGETLEDRIAKGPLSLKDALDIARQASEGLQAAHGEGIFHRDINPANIQISPEGRATVMDFGLARLTEASRLTKFDTAMGTVAYMSPEQAQGMEVDGRTDLWSLGCVLYEMVSGQRPFQGQYDQALLYEIVHEEPAALTGLRTGVPVELELLASKCLAKDREDRYQSAKEIAVDLRTLAEKLKSGRSTILRPTDLTAGVPATTTTAQTLNPAETSPPGAVIVQQKSQRALQGLAVALGVALLGLAFVHFTQDPPPTPTRRFSFSQEGLSAVSISPDSRYVAFAVGTPPESSLWLRALGSETAREIPGTEGARAVVSGWSPDSESIVFATTTEIKRVAIDGGDPVTLAGLPGTGSAGFRGVSWSPDNERIVFSSTGGALWEVPARGGEPRRLLESLEGGARAPHFLPADTGPEALVYEAGSRIWVLDLEKGERREIGPGSAPVYSPDGYLIHGSGDTGEPGLLALPFSRASLEPTGEAFPIARGGQSASVARDGTLVYLDGSRAQVQTLVWRDRAGEVLETSGQPQQDLDRPALAPDGRRIAVASRESGVSDIWIHDLIRSTKTRLTFDEGAERNPTWSPSGQEVTYWSQDDEGHRLMSTSADGTGEPVVLVESANILNAPDWSRDGRYLLYYEINPETRIDIRYIELGADGTAGEPVTFLDSSATERDPKLSPDGSFLAYSSDESGRDEIYVRPFPNGAGKWQVSVNGGRYPRWSRVENELYYLEPGIITLMAIPVSTEQGFTLGQPQVLFEDRRFATGGPGPRYDVSADGERFVMVAPVEGGEETETRSVRLVENWYEEFRERDE